MVIANIIIIWWDFRTKRPPNQFLIKGIVTKGKWEDRKWIYRTIIFFQLAMLLILYTLGLC